MTPDAPRSLLAGGETLDIEFKSEERQPLSDDALVEAVACLANRAGGERGGLLLGVEDDGRVTGARPRHGNRTEPLRIQALVANRTRPALTVRAEIVPLDGRDVLVLEVPASPWPVGTSDGKFLRRAIGGDAKPACLPMQFHEMQSQQAGAIPHDHTLLDLPDARWEDLDPLEIERFRLVVEESQAERPLSLDDLLLLNALWLERRLTTAAAANLAQKPENDVRARLQRLVEAGLVEARGERKGRSWHLAAAAYRRLGDKAAYVHLRGFEPLQQEAMVLQYVARHGRITRSDAAELCRIASSQARNLLARLTSQGKLLLHGARRGAWYGLPSINMDASKTPMGAPINPPTTAPPTSPAEPAPPHAAPDNDTPPPHP